MTPWARAGQSDRRADAQSALSANGTSSKRASLQQAPALRSTLGRYTEHDPLGFVDGPSVYAYAKGIPHSFVDPDGREVVI